MYDKDERDDLSPQQRTMLRRCSKRSSKQGESDEDNREASGQPEGKRDVFAELTEGMVALNESREGKRTLRTHTVEFKPAPRVTPKELIRVRESLNMSRALFAVYLRTNVRTLENWEQGRAKPNAQAALLINLVKLFPDTVQRLATI